ncbi:hypothetical protein FIBSPDRAFT_895727 [Athelia psychrophila]|uniref:Uncharacterized protein n=1 Tax=Athelia psychrophila TaxID=1759441 RepID=A0A166EAM5_9AGAM|nr:hypothetical protein FIBSPDRAFT_895727 [Fibularhizoctonia sp. CBS 109695]
MPPIFVPTCPGAPWSDVRPTSYNNVHVYRNFIYAYLSSMCYNRILDTPLSIPPIIPAVSSAPLIFQMTGIIDAVTRRHDVFNARQSVSFWLKSPIDTASRVFWSRIPTALRTIADVAGRPLHYTNFFGIDNEAQLCKIKIGWEVELDEGNIPRSEFPVFLNGERVSFERLLDHRQPVRAAFILTYGSSLPEARVALTASLYTLSMLS